MAYNIVQAAEFEPTAAHPFDPRVVPQPPRLHWGFVLALQIVTLGMFQLVWLPVQANWARKITGDRSVLIWALAPICSIVMVLSFAFLYVIGAAATGHPNDLGSSTAGLDSGFRLIFVIINIAAIFKVRAALETDPIRLSLSGGMTFFFQSIYFQYFLRDYPVLRPEEVYGRMPESPAYVPPISQEPSL